MLNLFVITGRLVADPQLCTTTSNLSVTSFTLAVDRPHQTNKGDKIVDFFNCVAWKGNAEFVTKYFKKGNLMTIQGYMTTRTYDDKKGVKHKVYEVNVDTIHFAETKKKDEAVPIDDFQIIEDEY